MKKFYFHFIAFAFVVLVASCNKDDEAKPDPIIGTWEADKIRLSGLPEKYSSLEGTAVLPELIGVLQYKYEFRSDMTFDWEMKENSGVIYEAGGTWANNKTSYSLSFDQASKIDVTLEGGELSEVETGASLRLRDPSDSTKTEIVPVTMTYIMEKTK